MAPVQDHVICTPTYAMHGINTGFSPTMNQATLHVEDCLLINLAFKSLAGHVHGTATTYGVQILHPWAIYLIVHDIDSVLRKLAMKHSRFIQIQVLVKQFNSIHWESASKQPLSRSVHHDKISSQPCRYSRPSSLTNSLPVGHGKLL